MTLEKDHGKNGGPKSVLKLIEDHGIENAFLVDDNLSGFLEGYYNAKSMNVPINFGVRMTVCDDMTVKTPESLKNESKIIIFLNNSVGYDKLFKIYSHAATEGLYYVPRIDLKTLESMWADGLSLGIPFYDSYLFQNHFRLCNIMPPNFWCDTSFFKENNGLPFDEKYGKTLDAYLLAAGREPAVGCQSIFYNAEDDFLAYLTMRCIGKRSSLQKPNLAFMSSDQFCVESWGKKCKNN